jgi:cytoskeletal protein CcmA (bactofilin family)
MFGQEPKESNKEEFRDAETIIGPSVSVKGNFNSTGNIVIEGILQGGVKTAGNIYVGDHADITANLEAKSARVGGNIKGNLQIEGKLQIAATAKIFGDIECSLILIDSGAIINGKITMTKELPAEKKINKQDSLEGGK